MQTFTRLERQLAISYDRRILLYKHVLFKWTSRPTQVRTAWLQMPVLVVGGLCAPVNTNSSSNKQTNKRSIKNSAQLWARRAVTDPRCVIGAWPDCSKLNTDTTCGVWETFYWPTLKLECVVLSFSPVYRPWESDIVMSSWSPWINNLQKSSAAWMDNWRMA